MPTTTRTAEATPGSVTRLGRSWELSLRAGNKSPRTVEGYRDTLRLFDDHLADAGMPRQVASISREHIESYLVALLDRGNKASTVATRHKGLRVFFGWLAEEGEVADNPMRNIKAPAIPDEPVPILSAEDIKALLKACDGPGFEDRRDTAIIMLLLDTGMRRTELADLRVDDIDWDNQTVVVMGKGRRPRPCPFGNKTAKALDRYERARASHRLTDTHGLWLGPRGTLTSPGVYFEAPFLDAFREAYKRRPRCRCRIPTSAYGRSAPASSSSTCASCAPRWTRSGRVASAASRSPCTS